MRRGPRAPQPLDVARVLDARRARGLVAVFDLDGTLAPIAPTPEAARVAPATRRALRRLARRADTVVGIVSGRPLADLERMIGRGGFWLAGLHGAVRLAPGEAVRQLWSREVQEAGLRLARALATSLDGVPGVRIEPKGPVVAVHTRAASPAGRARVRNVVSALRPAGWTLLEGRRVVELRPEGLPNKGDAVQWIAAHRPDAAVLYVGDDATDEDAFRALRRGDFAVAVDPSGARAERGPAAGATHASFALGGTDTVGALVERLAPAAPRRPRGGPRPAPARRSVKLVPRS
jgi:trehalose 6-phosphate phosphatase